MKRTDFIVDRRTRAEKKHWKCKDCGKDTFVDMKDYYMVTDEVWGEYGCGNGMLCIECLEGRIGHKLSREDITECPLNYDNPYTEPLLESN